MGRQHTVPTITLSRSGLQAALTPDRFIRGGFVLTVDDVPQSQVTPDRPEALVFEYIQRIGAIIDLVRPHGEAITSLHLGAGALTLPRYISHTRPGSRSQVVDWEEDLVEFVREPDSHLGFIALNWMTMGQLLTVPMIAIGVWLLFIWKESPGARIS